MKAQLNVLPLKKYNLKYFTFPAEENASQPEAGQESGGAHLQLCNPPQEREDGLDVRRQRPHLRRHPLLSRQGHLGHAGHEDLRRHGLRHQADPAAHQGHLAERKGSQSRFDHQRA